MGVHTTWIKELAPPEDSCFVLAFVSAQRPRMAIALGMFLFSSLRNAMPNAFVHQIVPTGLSKME